MNKASDDKEQIRQDSFLFDTTILSCHSLQVTRDLTGTRVKPD